MRLPRRLSDRAKLPDVSRRQLLVGGAVGGALVVGWSLWPRQYPMPLAPGAGEQQFGAYLRIGNDGAVIVSLPQCEMGQGVSTILPQIVAQELGADWRTVAVEAAPVSALFANHVLAGQWAAILWPMGLDNVLAGSSRAAKFYATQNLFQVTAGGTSIANYELPCREAGAMARVMLCKAAAARWDVPWEECDTNAGFVTHDKRRLRFAELVDDAITQTPPRPIPLRTVTPGEAIIARSLGGNIDVPFPRLDLPALVDGSANFAGDIRLPDMVFAAIRQGPPGDSRLKAVNRNAARNIVGLIEVVKHERWVAAIAGNWWAANRALSLMKPKFETSGRLADSASIDAALDSALAAGGYRLHETGDLDAAFEGQKPFAARYSAAPALHGAIETNSATARYSGGSLELWLASQAPQAARVAAADALGISPRDVVLYPMRAGGSFDQRLETGIAAQVALLAKHMGRPVQLIWSRGEEAIHDMGRSPVKARMAAVTDKAGNIAALSARIAVPATAKEFGQRLGDGKSPVDAMRAVRGDHDAMAVAGSIPPYAIANIAVDHHPADIGIPTGRWRGNADSYGAFFTECFIDELAHRARREPMSYRMAMLGAVPRLARCVTGVASLAEWDGGLDNSGQGIACHAMQGGYIAVVATARRSENGVRVDKLTAMVDIGRVINVDIALQQIEGGMIFGLAMALGGATGYERGLATARRLRDLNLPKLADTPEIIIELVDSQETPVDPGEIGVAAVAPAIANALFSATGLRFRTLPLLADGL